MKLWLKIFIGLIAGSITGFIIGEKALHLKILGDLFLGLISMIIVPLILSSTTIGVSNIHDPQKLGRIGGKTIGMYVATTLLAILWGISLANTFEIGNDVQVVAKERTFTEPFSIQAILFSILPTNPIASLVNGNILQIIVFSFFLGIAINFSGPAGKPLLHVLESLADVMYRLTSIIMEFAPIGVFGIMAWVTGTFGIGLFIPLLKFLVLYYAACLLHLILIYGGSLKFLVRLHLRPFFRGMRDAIMMAFSTCSSAATLPVAMHCTQENLGVSKNISNFVLPLGITLNMNGTAIYQAMSAIFIAKAYHIPLDFHHYVTLILTTILSAIGTAGVPGGGFVMLSAVLSSVGLPLEGLALLAGIDRLREMMTTVLNILGDAAVAVFIAKQEGELDERQYYHSNRIEMDNSNILA